MSAEGQTRSLATLVRQLQGLVARLQVLLDGRTIRRGQGVVTYPGGGSVSNVATVPHGLGVVPGAVVATARSGGTAGGVQTILIANETGASFQVGCFSSAVPAAGQTVFFDWIAMS